MQQNQNIYYKKEMSSNFKHLILAMIIKKGLTYAI